MRPAGPTASFFATQIHMINIIKGPHVLFVGANGKKTAGITVQSDLSPKECERQGRKHEWDINTYTLRTVAEPRDFGITREVLTEIIHECQKLEDG